LAQKSAEKLERRSTIMSTKTVSRPGVRRILTPAETQSLTTSIKDNADDTAVINHRNLYNPDRVNTPAERETIERQKRVLAQGQPDSINKHERASLENRNKQDKEWLQKNMVPKSHVMLRPNPMDPQYRKAVNEMARRENSPEFQKVAERFKNGMRQLGRFEDANLETIRPSSR